MIFDTHSHYTSHRFDDHRTQLLDSLPGQGVCAVVDCATDFDTPPPSVWPWRTNTPGCMWPQASIPKA